MPTDALSDVLGAIRLTGAVYFRFDLSAPWVAAAPPSRELAAVVLPGHQRIIEYHVVASGRCWARLHDGPPIRLESGDIVAFPQGDAHIMSSDPALRSAPDPGFFQPAARLPILFEQGGGGEHTRVICGFLGCDERPFNPLLEALPRVIHARARDRTQPGWLQTLVETAVHESDQPRPGGTNVLARLSELLFVDVVRQYVAAEGQERGGWLAGLSDPVVGRALAVMHGAPAHEWTLDELARESATSRTVLADRFTTLVGHPPMQYLTRWRMQLAARRLAGGADTLATVAEAVGYESEAAFSRAFKRTTGLAPAHWRREARVTA